MLLGWGCLPPPWTISCLHRKESFIITKHKLSLGNQLRAQLRVATPPAIDTALAGDPNAQLLGPFIDTDADTELIRYRRTCYVPPCYVPLFLAGPLSPRDAWIIVKSQIDTDNNAVSCSALVDYP